MTSRARSLSLYLGAERQEPGRSDKNRSLPRSDHAGERDCREGAFRQEGLYPVYAPAARRSERRRQGGLDREARGGHLRERVYVSFEQPPKMDVMSVDRIKRLVDGTSFLSSPTLPERSAISPRYRTPFSSVHCHADRPGNKVG